MAWTDADALHRHAWKAYEDFRRLRDERENEELWHSLSHHLRHVVHRSGEGVTNEERHLVRRHR